MENCEVIHQGWLFINIDSPHSVLKRKSKGQWKQRYFVFYREPENVDKIILACFKKEENLKNLTPKHILKLYPKYKIAKIYNFKSKEQVLEVNNFEEQWFLSASDIKIIDLWAIQIQMQTKLNQYLSGRVFQVSGAVNKHMQKIGAAQQRCLLQFTKWGVTLALQDSRAILSMWPLTTIRNYEFSGQCIFSIEAGRKAPMGEGLFTFYTNIGEDIEMFNTIDNFVQENLNKKAIINSESRKNDEISETYDKLYLAATGFDSSLCNQSNNKYSHGFSTRSLKNSESSPISISKPPDYNTLFKNKDKNSLKIHDGSSQDLSGNRFYDHLSNAEVKESSDTKECYDHINQFSSTRVSESSYDTLIHNETGFDFQRMLSQENDLDFSFSSKEDVFSDLHAEGSTKFKDSSTLLSKSFNDTHEFQNKIYTPSLVKKTSGSEVSQHHISMPNVSQNSFSRKNQSSIRHHSSSDHKGTPEFNNKCMKDIADHFLYQTPSSLNSLNLSENK
ncbi:uncharacterized protein LOC100212589 [Hydra vulgaris]|uniref:uncharacterized protein LOC100212589 n=1 Tax=Hydra vulgaris TaxID=6087 RepID=UPI001F5F9BF8|nr:uncharacterized protein LOC100212589 [Hydra vulgaris]